MTQAIERLDDLALAVIAVVNGQPAMPVERQTAAPGDRASSPAD